MPAKSEEALNRKRLRRRARRIGKRLVITKSMLPSHKISARRMMPKLPDMTKSELRAMLAQIAQNTAG